MHRARSHRRFLAGVKSIVGSQISHSVTRRNAATVTAPLSPPATALPPSPPSAASHDHRSPLPSHHHCPAMITALHCPATITAQPPSPPLHCPATVTASALPSHHHPPLHCPATVTASALPSHHHRLCTAQPPSPPLHCPATITTSALPSHRHRLCTAQPPSPPLHCPATITASALPSHHHRLCTATESATVTALCCPATGSSHSCSVCPAPSSPVCAFCSRSLAAGVLYQAPPTGHRPMCGWRRLCGKAIVPLLPHAILPHVVQSAVCMEEGIGWAGGLSLTKRLPEVSPPPPPPHLLPAEQSLRLRSPGGETSRASWSG
ncbi:WAS/WASL-interacting protein family member 3 [Lethenteron reissneri]|uniref:WAS/WASL-interacting protein family member 3 n=1 Tax=Lethenteron reissneri TaxID=7753 RepID=UPI002AB63F48|nr:WAS/WASL-interacting protein family member 3 [Lethenteron reissneri]XP_061403650.1 WAS/WASL-interacting protein family member 3 [Lethenteron reissneri]XP_061403651.1 WAS/WASL-interacting protein family member 3 [Lethenteron reissneri]XP_061403652.1 WAS/WASL-interacting protein family member 3 [Lethenteron reissneri]XP_061403653.1 WAS/WASL-interacting protein family member 3 [Lethenteron reissneri]XP_061403655.1 WAS/WASL-interacting protein family member 3 [Lethenteron reissneri]XP_06140365